MNNLKRFNSYELTAGEMNSIDGGGPIQSGTLILAQAIWTGLTVIATAATNLGNTLLD